MVLRCLLLFFLSAFSLYGQNLPPDFYHSRVASGFQRPLGMDIAEDGRLFVYEQGGKVWIVDTSGQRQPSQPLIDISEEVSEWHDHGLLGFCLDRDFSSNGYLYLLYAVDRYWEAQHDQEHPESSLQYTWQTYLHHNDHFHPEIVTHEKSSYLYLEPLGCGEEDYYFRVRLRVTDPEGLYSEVEQHLYPNCESLAALQLQASAASDHIAFDWEGPWAFDDATFELQIASNLREFKTLAELDPSRSQHRYSSPPRGTRYYRLKRISADRQLVYSNVVAITWSRPANISLSPNPSSGLVTSRMREAYLGGRIFFELYDATGRLVRKTDWLAAASSQGVERFLQLGDLANGQYFYLFRDEQGLNFPGALLFNR